jgi:tetratricopeptide (TPR) repeat protein
MQKQQQGRKKLPLGLWITVIVVILFILGFGVATILILERQGIHEGSIILSIAAAVIAVAVGLSSLMIGFFQWRYPFHTAHPGQTEPSMALPHFSTQQIAISNTIYRGILGLPPPVNPKTIQHREKIVNEVYEKLTQLDITAIVLTGIGGVGKSTLAAMVYEYTEEQRLKRKGPFNAEPLWLRVDPAVVMSDLIGTLFEALGKPIPDLTSLSPHNQAVALFNVLNTTSKPRLIILDQFENLLDWRTGFALPERTGVGEWLDAINSRKCICRLLLTSRPWPSGTQEYPPTYMQEYCIEGLEKTEGIELLLKQGVQATEAELSTAVEYCKGHALSLTLLASLLRNRSLSLSLLLKDQIYTQIWEGNIASNLLDSIYSEQLNEVQQRLLVAFSIYREPVTLDAAKTVIDLTPKPSQQQIEHTLDTLLGQHLIQAKGEGRYQLHIIVESYVKHHIVVEDKLVNLQTLSEAHAKAAAYYQQEAVTGCPPRQQRRKISDFHYLIEAIWHYCQAEQWPDGYALIEQEEMAGDLAQVGGYVILRELYQLLVPLEKWHPEPIRAAKLYAHIGGNCLWLDKNEEAIKHYEQALSIWRELGDRKEEGSILNCIGGAYHSMGWREEAIKFFKQALNISKEVGDKWNELAELNNLGSLYNELDNKAQSLKYYEQASKVYCEEDLLEVKSSTLNTVGVAYSRIGKHEEAIKYYKKSLSRKEEKESNNSIGKCRTLNNLGRVYSRLKEYEEAINYHEQALDIAVEIGNQWSEIEALDRLGEVYKESEKYEMAQRYYEQAQ